MSKTIIFGFNIGQDIDEIKFVAHDGSIIGIGDVHHITEISHWWHSQLNSYVVCIKGARCGSHLDKLVNMLKEEKVVLKFYVRNRDASVDFYELPDCSLFAAKLGGYRADTEVRQTLILKCRDYTLETTYPSAETA